MLLRFLCLTETNFASYMPNYQPQCPIGMRLGKRVRKAIKILKNGASRVSVDSRRI